MDHDHLPHTNTLCELEFYNYKNSWILSIIIILIFILKKCWNYRLNIVSLIINIIGYMSWVNNNQQYLTVLYVIHCYYEIISDLWFCIKKNEKLEPQRTPKINHTHTRHHPHTSSSSCRKKLETKLTRQHSHGDIKNGNKH